MSEMVDSVARAIVASYGIPNQSKFDMLHEHGQEAARKCARAAIVAVQDIIGEKLMQKCGGACAGAFEGIIDEALKP